MILNTLPEVDPLEIARDHSFVFDAHNHDRKQLITRYRGTSVIKTASGRRVTGWQKSIYHFGGLNREVPIVVTVDLDDEGIIKGVLIDEQSNGSQGKRCDFACLEALCRDKLDGVAITGLGGKVTSAPDVKCLHLFEILSACSSFCAYLLANGLEEGTEQEYIAICPDGSGLTSDTTHEILGKRDHMRIRLDHRTQPALNDNNLAKTIDALVTVQYNDEEALTEELSASDFESVYAQFNRLFSKCHHIEKSHFGVKGRARFFNTPSMTGLFLLTVSHSGLRGGVARALKIEKILHYLQTGYGKNPCKGFGG